MKQINKKYNLSELNRVLFYILVIFILYFLSMINLHADQKKLKEFNYNIMGKTIRDEKINFLAAVNLYPLNMRVVLIQILEGMDYIIAQEVCFIVTRKCKRI